VLVQLLLAGLALAAAFSCADAARAPVALEEGGAATAVLLGQAPAAGRDAVRWSSRSSISSSTAAEAAVVGAEYGPDTNQ
jgi:hypothetical protein